MLGLGLIGGSIARASLAAGHEVSAWTPTGAGPTAAAHDGVRAARSLSEAVAEADLVVIAAPPLAALELVDRLADAGSRLPIEAVVTDVTSTKRAIVERATSAHLRFVGGHPLAGRETSGYGAADASLFRDRPWVVVPPQPADPGATDRVGSLVDACAARLVEMTAADHDRAVAGISHLPLLVSAALAASVAGGSDWANASALAAGGWAGMTRLARGDVEMGAGILATNADEVAGRLLALSAELDAWAADLRAEDPGRLRARLAAAREAAEATARGNDTGDDR
jgi:prephenate dehydrogenase